MKTILTILIASMMLVAFALPMILGEDNDTDSSAAIALYNDTSNIAEGLVISPAPNNTVNEEIEQEASEDDDEKVGFGEIGWNHVKLWFAFNQEKKAELQLKIARLRLIQARIAAKNNNSIAMEKALEAHERILEKLNQTMTKIENGLDNKRLNESADKLIGLERAIQVHELKIIRLRLVLENANLTEEQKAKIENRISHVENVTLHLREVQEAKLEKVKTKLMAVGNLTEEQANDMVQNRQDRLEQRIQQKLNNGLRK